MKMKAITILSELPPPGAVPTSELLDRRIQELADQFRSVPPGAEVTRRGRDLVAAMAFAAACAGWAGARIYRSELGPGEELEIRADQLPALAPGVRVIARIFSGEGSGEIIRISSRGKELWLLLRELKKARAQVAWVEARDVRAALVDIPSVPDGLQDLLELAQRGDEVVANVHLPPPGAFSRFQLAQAAWALLGRWTRERPGVFFRRHLRLAGERVEAGIAQALAFTAARAGARGLRMAIPEVGERELLRPAGLGVWPGDTLDVPGIGKAVVEAVGPGPRGLRILIRAGRAKTWRDWP